MTRPNTNRQIRAYGVPNHNNLMDLFHTFQGTCWDHTVFLSLLRYNWRTSCHQQMVASNGFLVPILYPCKGNLGHILNIWVLEWFRQMSPEQLFSNTFDLSRNWLVARLVELSQQVLRCTQLHIFLQANSITGNRQLQHRVLTDAFRWCDPRLVFRAVSLSSLQQKPNLNTNRSLRKHNALGEEWEPHYHRKLLAMGSLDCLVQLERLGALWSLQPKYSSWIRKAQTDVENFPYTWG